VTEKQSVAATGKKRGPYSGVNNKCAIPHHNHVPRDCPGRARIMCAVCGKSLLSHETMDYCDRGEPATVHYLNKEGRRQ